MVQIQNQVHKSHKQSVANSTGIRTMDRIICFSFESSFSTDIDKYGTAKRCSWIRRMDWTLTGFNMVTRWRGFSLYENKVRVRQMIKNATAT